MSGLPTTTRSALMLADELHQAREAVVGPGALDDAQRPRDRSCGVGDGHAGARRAVVEGEDLHEPAAEAISVLPIS